MTNVTCYTVKSSKNFESKIAKLLSEYKEVYVKYIDLFQPVCRGQYVDKLTLVCDGNEIIMREHHNTTPDDYRDMENMISVNNFTKRRILSIIESNI
jgi:hypothetical protein